MAGETAILRGWNILVVEDAFLIAIDICLYLESCGCTITGPVARLWPALQLARTEPISGAVLDVNLDGEPIFPVASALDARHVPYVFLTGYDDETAFPVRFRHVPRFSKPFHHTTLRDILIRNIAGSRIH